MRTKKIEHIVRWSFAISVLLGTWLVSRSALAYPWMIRHEYTGCATCHTDPSGGGLLTPYGRAQAAVLLSSRVGLPSNEEEPGKYKDFAFGVVPLPEEIALQGWLRSAYLVNASAFKIVDKRFLLMRADVGTHIKLGALRASGMIGLASSDSPGFTHQAWLTTSADGVNLVSREHWIGAALAEDAVLLRVGRIGLPYGLRNLEHTSWVRSDTQTDTNQQQQHGIAVAYTGEKLRAEAMVVLGNFQLGPDPYRERGYSAYAEYAISSRAALGMSTSILHAAADVSTRKPDFRHGHGVFARIATSKELAFLAEADIVVKSIRLDNPATDLAGFAQADYEPVQGLHVVATGELLAEGRAHKTLVGGWLSAWWFAFAHVDARIDLIQRSVETGPSTTTALFQLHGYL